MHPRRLLIALLLLPINAISHAATIDCEHAHNQVDTMVCTDPSVLTLDAQLGVAYARFIASASHRNTEKSVHSAWLEIRNACADVACLKGAYQARLAELKARTVSDMPLVGFWRKVDPCAGATGIYAERCKQGEHDTFSLDVQTNGNHVCITHMATGQMNNRVDYVEGVQPSMTGSGKANAATVSFLSSWGGSGTAMLRVQGNSLHWKVVTKDAGASWIPDEEVLARVPARAQDRMPDCEAK